MQPDSLHRLAKSLIDSGEARTIPEALETFSKYGVRIRIPPQTATDVGRQILALTAINCASRSFLGNVLIESEDFTLSAPGFEGEGLQSFLGWAGVQPNLPAESARWPRIVINDDPVERGDLVAWSSGWEFGVGEPSVTQSTFAPACVAAAGLVVSEAFSVLRSDNPYAGRRRMHLSLWSPGHRTQQLPPVQVPTQDSLWLVGLGHLGQAYAWTLGFMAPGPRPIFLQDVDVVTESTLSTSMVSSAVDRGQRKARVAARWLEARGYDTAIVERRFDEAQRVRPDEPSIAFFGVDNAAARRAIELAGFRLAIDAGLGSGFKDFRGLRVRTFPGPASAAKVWASANDAQVPVARGYQHLIEQGADRCGVTLLATRAVGAPFVGCVAAGYVLAERIRRQMGAHTIGFLDSNLREPERAETDFSVVSDGSFAE